MACLLVDKIFCFEDNGFADSHFSQGCSCRLSVFVDNKVYWVRNFESYRGNLLAGGAVAEAPFTVVLSTHSLHHEWFVVFNGINLLAESVPSN